MKRALVAAALAALAACSLQPATTTTQQQPKDAVAKADAKLFAGDYDGAATAYDQLLKTDQSARAHAHHALLLDYLNRFDAAATEAQAAATTATDSDTLAHTTRALDWAEQLPAALATGKKATDARPVSPLARVYYSEALSDAGRYEDARAQLLLAEKAGGDTYTKAEIEREWANYYHDRGDRLEELNHLQLSIKDQPNFPERSFELARYYFNLSDSANADKFLTAPMKRHPGSYWINVVAGDTALLNLDNNAAPAYKAAQEVKHDGIEAALGLAEVQVLAQKDYAGADATLSADSSDPATKQFKYWLETLLLNQKPADPDATAADRQTAFAAVNDARAKAHLPALPEDKALDQAAEAHAFFFLFNFGDPSLANLGIHNENPQLPGYTGANGAARAQHFGYSHPRVAEVIAHAVQPQGAVADWVDSVYHRYPLLDPGAVNAGYGEARVGILTIQVMEVGADTPRQQQPVVFPADGQQNVPTEFRGGELPDPLPGARYPVGYPITLQVADSQSLVVATATLTGPDGKEIPTAKIVPGTRSLTAGEFAMLAQDPFAPGKYTAHLSGTLDGNQFDLSWSFQVAGPG